MPAPTMPVFPLVATPAVAAPVAVVDQTKPVTPVSGNDSNVHIVELDEDAEKWEKVNEKKHASSIPTRPGKGSLVPNATSTFHGAAEFDYQGRPWTTKPAGVHASDDDHDCYLPKKCIKKFLGHTKGVQAIEFFPQTGHLLLSASMDGKVKIWDNMTDKNVRRTYQGHAEAVR